MTASGALHEPPHVSKSVRFRCCYPVNPLLISTYASIPLRHKVQTTSAYTFISQEQYCKLFLAFRRVYGGCTVMQRTSADNTRFFTMPLTRSQACKVPLIRRLPFNADKRLFLPGRLCLRSYSKILEANRLDRLFLPLFQRANYGSQMQAALEKVLSWIVVALEDAPGSDEHEALLIDGIEVPESIMFESINIPQQATVSRSDYFLLPCVERLGESVIAAMTGTGSSSRSRTTVRLGRHRDMLITAYHTVHFHFLNRGGIQTGSLRI